jgi:hypothetical protein
VHLKATLFGVLGGLLCGGLLSFALTTKADPGPVINPDPQFCNAPVFTAFLLSDAGPSLVPFNNAPGRRFITVCNSAENGGSPIVKCGVAPTPTFHDAGILIVDGGAIAVPGVCYHDGGPSCGSTNTYNGDLDGGPFLLDAGCQQQILIDGGPDCLPHFPGTDGGPCLIDGGPYDAGFADAGCPLVDAGALLDGGFIDAGYICAPPTPQCVQSWKLSGAQNPPRDGGFTFADGGPCLADAGFCLVDGGIVLFDAGPQVTDSGWVFQDGGPYLGNTMPGDALKVGECMLYPVGGGQQVICIGTGSLATTVGVEATECQ